MTKTRFGQARRTLAWWMVPLLLLSWVGGCERSPAQRSDETSSAPKLSGEPIKVGVLHSLTGTLAVSEKPVVDAVLMAIDDLNDSGGVLSRPVEAVLVDGQSDETVFAEKMKDLLELEQVVAVFGCWSSASRRTVKPIVEAAGSVLFYPVQYEGLESSPNIVYLGSAPNQQILPSVDWAIRELGAKRFFLVGSDYIFPHAANAIIKDRVAELGGTIVGEKYLPLGSLDVDGVIEEIETERPDIILNTINGDTNFAFFDALRSADIWPEDVPTMSFSIGEQELRGMRAEIMTGDYAAWNYFQSVSSQENTNFVRFLSARKRGRAVVNDPMQSAWNAVHLWAIAAEAAGSVQPLRVLDSIRGMEFDAPEGPIRVDENNQHTWLTSRIGKITPARQFDIVYESEHLVPPNPYPTTRSPEEWNQFVNALNERWGGSWSNSGDATSSPLELAPMNSDEQEKDVPVSGESQ